MSRQLHSSTLVMHLLLLFILISSSNLLLAATPINDNLNDAIELNPANIEVVRGSNQGATSEWGEFSSLSISAGSTVWYKWTPTSSEQISIGTCDSNLDTVLAIYTGDDVKNLELEAYDNQNSSTDQSQVLFSPKAGTTYYISVDGYKYASTTQGSFSLLISYRSSNDYFADATVIPSTLPHQIYATNLFATREPGEPDHLAESDNASGRSSLWWKWKAQSNEEVSIDTFGSNFDTVLAVYTGNAVDSLTEIISNDVANNTYQSRVRFQPFAGTTYYIVVDGWRNDDTGAISLYTEQLQLPPNDNFNQATVITSIPSSFSGKNIDATWEEDEPDHHFDNSYWYHERAGSLWWKLTLPNTQTVTIDTFGSDFDTILAVYTGTSVNSLTKIASNDDSSRGNYQSQVRITPQPGVDYYISVNGYDELDIGTVQLNLNGVDIMLPSILFLLNSTQH